MTRSASSRRQRAPDPLRLRYATPATKLSPPPVLPSLVRRERLLKTLDAAFRHRLTLVSAPAGWGKTTLASAWAARHAGRVAWLSLDRMDGVPLQFWCAVIRALRLRLDAPAHFGAVAERMLESTEHPAIAAYLTTLIGELTASRTSADSPLALVIDDYHLVGDATVHEGVAYLVDRLPPAVHLVILSRSDPDLPLARWRVTEEPQEIRVAELRFTSSEVQEFFAQLPRGPRPLSMRDIRTLEERTEGWPVALQLASLALRDAPEPSDVAQRFSGRHRLLVDYVEQEVLARQPPEVRRFLLETSVLERLSAGACSALTGQEFAASQRMLVDLERRNLFVVPLDDERRWFRLHDLLRQTLQARLADAEPTLERDLHARAARWHEELGHYALAIEHALAAHDFDLAATLIERTAQRLWLRGEALTVHDWILALPDSVLVRHARLALDSAKNLLESVHGAAQGVFDEARAKAEQAMARIESSDGACAAAPDDVEFAISKRRARLLRVLIASRSVFKGGSIGQLQRLVGEASSLVEHETVQWRLIWLGIRFSLIVLRQREGAQLIPELLTAKEQMLETGERHAALAILRMLALAYLRAARPRRVEDVCLEALNLIEELGVESVSKGYFHYYLSNSCQHANRLDDAAVHVQAVLEVARTWHQVPLLIASHLNLMLLALARGDARSAGQSLDELDGLVRQESFVTYAGLVEAARAHFWLETGEVELAGEWAEQIQLTPKSWNPNRVEELLLVVRVLVAKRLHDRALATLDRFHAELDRANDVDTTVHYLALRWVVLAALKRRREAFAVGTRLLQMTEPEGCVRIYLEQGEPMRSALQELASASHPRAGSASLPAPLESFALSLLTAFRQTSKIRIAKTLVQRERHGFGTAPKSLEPLTEREREVFRLVAAAASNAEIANGLGISVATVKKHVGNILAKLGVQNRVQAVALASEAAL